MSAIYIIAFNRKICQDFIPSIPVPTFVEHWGILVEYKGESNFQILYHADKTNTTNFQTSYEEEPYSRLNNRVDLDVLIGYSTIRFSQGQMTEICNNVTNNRKFNTLTNNCQEWVKEVLKELVRNGHLFPLCFKELEEINEMPSSLLDIVNFLLFVKK